MVKGVFITGFERCQAVYVSLKAFNFGTIYIFEERFVRHCTGHIVGNYEQMGKVA
jgi:hypothetical protein